MAIVWREITIQRATHKISNELMYRTDKKGSKEVKSNNFCDRKVGRAIHEEGATQIMDFVAIFFKKSGLDCL